MPQTSPMNWMFLSVMPLLMVNLLNFNKSKKTTMKEMSKMKYKNMKKWTI